MPKPRKPRRPAPPPALPNWIWLQGKKEGEAFFLNLDRVVSIHVSKKDGKDTVAHVLTDSGVETVPFEPDDLIAHLVLTGVEVTHAVFSLGKRLGVPWHQAILAIANGYPTTITEWNCIICKRSPGDDDDQAWWSRPGALCRRCSDALPRLADWERGKITREDLTPTELETLEGLERAGKPVDAIAAAAQLEDEDESEELRDNCSGCVNEDESGYCPLGYRGNGGPCLNRKDPEPAPRPIERTVPRIEQPAQCTACEYESTCRPAAKELAGVEGCAMFLNKNGRRGRVIVQKEGQYRGTRVIETSSPVDCRACTKWESGNGCTWNNGGPLPCPDYVRRVASSADRSSCPFGEAIADDCRTFPRCDECPFVGPELNTFRGCGHFAGKFGRGESPLEHPCTVGNFVSTCEGCPYRPDVESASDQPEDLPDAGAGAGGRDADPEGDPPEPAV